MQIGNTVNTNVLMHCHGIPTAHPRKDDPAIQGSIRQLLSLRAIERAPQHRGQVYVTTPLGRAWVKAMTLTEIPRATYTDAAGNPLTD